MRNDLENRPSQGWLTVRFSYLPPNNKDGVGYRKIAETLQISVDTSRDVVYNRS